MEVFFYKIFSGLETVFLFIVYIILAHQNNIHLMTVFLLRYIC